ncbi:MAG TPA: peptide chain release factor 1 [Firmicutes bacterium]|nr:peptide chain release factor 1 [Bacillota bacterium]
MDERLKIIGEKYEKLEEELSTPEVLSDFQKLKELSKQKSDLEEIVSKYKEYTDCSKELEELYKMKNDPEMSEMIEEEIVSLESKKETLFHELEILLIPKDENDGKNIIMEIRGAAGGDEANIFAGDLFRMYSYYAASQGWKIDIIHSVDGSSGGYSQIECMIKGENVYSKLKYESGSHRVQRIPVTETQGRVHTSTATVLVMPEVEDVSIDINEADIKMDVYHSSGAGGQSVNTANSAVRLTHIPTGVVVTCQTERSQLHNREQAMRLLKIKINDELVHKQEMETGMERRSKIGTGDRSEKIRTYNYPQNRVTDHRINYSIMDLEGVMDGKLEPIIEALITEDQRLKLEGSKLDA